MRLVRSILASLLLVFGLCGQAGSEPMTLSGVGGPAAGGGCSQATAFLARNGNANATITTTMICGMVTDGDWASLDVLYIFATDTSAHALLNAVSSSFTATTAGSPTFTASAGFNAPTPGTDFIHTGFIPSTAGGNYTLNSASLGYCNTTSSTAADGSTITGINNAAWLIQSQGGSINVFDMNDANFPSYANTQHQGFYIVTRTAASGAGALNVYKNGNTTPVGTDTGASASLPAVEYQILQSNLARSTSDQAAIVFYGGGLTAAATGRIYGRIHTYLVALGVSGC